MKTVYAVQWIEVEWGERGEGTALFLDKEECILKTKKASEAGYYPDGGGYCGPERPLTYYEIPFDSLEKNYQDSLILRGHCHTGNNWQPKFKSSPTRIK